MVINFGAEQTETITRRIQIGEQYEESNSCIADFGTVGTYKGADFEKSMCAVSDPGEKVLDMQIIKQSVDARKKDALSYTYTVHLVVDEHQKVKKNPAHVQEVHPVKYQIPAKPENASDIKAAVIGAGPAGLFAAYELAQCGLCPPGV